MGHHQERASFKMKGLLFDRGIGWGRTLLRLSSNVRGDEKKEDKGTLSREGKPRRKSKRFKHKREVQTKSQHI